CDHDPTERALHHRGLPPPSTTSHSDRIWRKPMNTSKRVIQSLETLGVEHVFGYPGGRIIELLDELPDSEIELIRPRDEREASVMAGMAGRLSEKPGILAGQGPWIGSIGGIGQMEARLSSSPMVVLTEASER